MIGELNLMATITLKVFVGTKLKNMYIKESYLLFWNYHLSILSSLHKQANKVIH